MSDLTPELAELLWPTWLAGQGSSVASSGIRRLMTL